MVAAAARPDQESGQQKTRRSGFSVRGRSAIAVGAADELLELVMGAQVGPRLGAGKLTFVHSYPATQAALARVDAADPRVARRFELYADGIELANGFDDRAEPRDGAAIDELFGREGVFAHAYQQADHCPLLLPIVQGGAGDAKVALKLGRSRKRTCPILDLGRRRIARDPGLALFGRQHLTQARAWARRASSSLAILASRASRA